MSTAHMCCAAAWSQRLGVRVRVHVHLESGLFLFSWILTSLGCSVVWEHSNSQKGLCTVGQED